MPNFFATLVGLLQDGGVQLGLAAIGAIILTLLFERYGASLLYGSIRAIMDFIKFDVYERAIHRFDQQGLNWLGFTHKTAFVSGVCALAVYFVVKTAVGFPDYWHVFVLIIVYIVFAFSVLGYRVSGPGMDLRKRFGKSFRHFFAPTFNGLLIFSLDGVVAAAKIVIAKWLT